MKRNEGIGKAVVVSFSLLTEEAKAQLRFEDWRKVGLASKLYGDFDLHDFSFQKMSETAETFKQWNKVSLGVLPGSSDEKNALQKMADLAKSFDQWKIIHGRSKKYLDLHELALQMMFETAAGFEQWKFVCSEIPRNSKFYNPGMKSLSGTAKNFD